MKAYLEKLDKEWYEDFVYISKYPLLERGYDVIGVDWMDIESGKFEFPVINTETDICIGSVQFCLMFFKACNVPVPKYLGYPESLQKYLGRNIIKTTFGVLKDDYPYFIKPSDDVKLFTGDVIKQASDLQFLRDFDNVTDKTSVYKSEIVDFISEYRVFVSLNEIRGIKHYRGDFTKFIDIDVLKKMVDDYTDCPSAFTLDVGVTSNGETLLIEVNDMWAIGSYGLKGEIYALLCARRMKEILKNK